MASGGFDAERIRRFEEAGVPVDAYGVGSWLLQGTNDFTADVVRVNGVPCAKVGREERPNPRLEPVEGAPARRWDPSIMWAMWSPTSTPASPHWE